MPRCRQQGDGRAVGMTHQVDRGNLLRYRGARFETRAEGIDDLHQDRNLGLHEPGLEPPTRFGPTVPPTVVDDGAHAVSGTKPAGDLLPRLDGAEAVVEKHGGAIGAAFAQESEAQPVPTERTLLGASQRVLEKKTSDCSRNGNTGIGTGMPGGGSRPKMMSGGGGTAVGDGSNGNTHSMWKVFAPAAMPV